jgi:hypothetical protein
MKIFQIGQNEPNSNPNKANFGQKMQKQTQFHTDFKGIKGMIIEGKLLMDVLHILMGDTGLEPVTSCV